MKHGPLAAFIGFAIPVFITAGCEAVRTPIDDNYEFGDTTADLQREAAALRARYCTAFEGSRARALAGDALRARGIPIPENGVCNDLLDAAAGTSQ